MLEQDQEFVALQWPFEPGERSVKMWVQGPPGGIGEGTGLMLCLHNWGGVYGQEIYRGWCKTFSDRYDVVAVSVNYLQSGDEWKLRRDRPYDHGYLQAMDCIGALYHVRRQILDAGLDRSWAAVLPGPTSLTRSARSLQAAPPHHQRRGGADLRRDRRDRRSRPERRRAMRNERSPGREGWRPDRRRPDRRHPHRLRDEVYITYNRPVFVTVCVKDQRPLLTGRIAETAIALLLERAKAAGVTIHMYCAMPTHLHFIASVVGASPLPDFMRSFKSGASGAINRLGLLTERFSWQRSYYDTHADTDEDLREHIAYVLENPVADGFCRRWEEWPHTAVLSWP
ncbi:MAG: transposase [Armatimonadota bacterium]|nr:transposase [Armatimonadota bacterium]